MKKRLIAILALVALSWSSAGAMTLALQRHMYTAPQSVPPTSNSQDHSCCPEGPAQLVPSIFIIPTLPPMPCEDSPCCARQAPSSSPSLPGTIWLSRPDSSRVAFREKVDTDVELRVRMQPQSLDTGPFQLSSIQTTVLRN